jgi:hypothetical protein
MIKNLTLLQRRCNSIDIAYRDEAEESRGKIEFNLAKMQLRSSSMTLL